MTASPKTAGRFARLLLLPVLAFAALPARADIAADFSAITGTTGGQTFASIYYPYELTCYGKAAFPILRDVDPTPNNGVDDSIVIMAAGRYNDSDADTAARAVVFGSSNFVTQSAPAATLGGLLENSAKWTGRKSTPGTIRVGCGSGVPTSFWTNRGFLTKSVTTTMSSSGNDLSGCDLLVLDINSNYSAAAITKIRSFTAAGGGLIVAGWPYNWNAQQIADMTAILAPFGVCHSKDTWRYNGSDSAVVPSLPFSPYSSAGTSASDLVRDKEGAITMTLADKNLAAASIDEAVALRTRLLSGFGVTLDLSAIIAELDLLSDASHYGTIAPTKAAPLGSSKPVERMLARHQSAKFDALTPAELFVHPATSDFPGLPAAATTTSKTISVNGNTPPNNLNNNGQRPVRFETGMYAAPGATITVTIPSDKIAAGLQVHIAGNGSEDTTWNMSNWTFFPKLWRRVPLTSATTQTGHVFGGLVTILVPPGSSLGTFNVTVGGVIPAPVFILGQNTDSEWNSTLKNHPAPYGFLQTDKLTLYVPKSQLAQMSNPTAVAEFWKKVMDTADEYYGYTPWRKRGEGIASSRYVSAGGAYATYPIEAGWGTDSDEFLDKVRLNGHWGNYHELGHGYQNNFDDAFVIPTHAEVDVNLFPAMMYALVHDQTTWEGPSFYSGSQRTTKRANFLALPAAEQTWAKACDTNTGPAYDFYYNISDAFGWTAYKTAFTRLMNHLQNPAASTDTELKLTALNSTDANYKRNRFYVLFCEATGRNLDIYFQRYGLGVPGKGYEITQSVKDLIASKGYPVWSDNSDIDSLSNPGTLTVDEITPFGSEIYQFTATDAEEPGTVWTYSITGGNTNNAFSIDKRTGKLRVRKLDAETAASYNLTVQVQDNGVPRFAKTSTFTVNVTNSAEPPQVAGKLFTATSAMGNGTALGTVTAVFEPGRTASAYAIAAGNDGHFSINATTGSVTVSNASTLPNPGIYTLTVKVTDSAGQSGYGYVTVLCNRSGGVYEERWTTQQMTGTPSTSVFSSFNAPQNVANNYVRRVSGWVIPPVTGAYTFWIASDDNSTLALSPDASNANKEIVASVSSYSGYQAWTANASQQSQQIFLQAGKPCYIETIHYEGSGNDHLSVAWSGPGISQAVIAGMYLVPNVPGVSPATPASTPPAIAITSPAAGSVYLPATLTATVTDNLNTINKVVFYANGSVLGEDATAPYSINWPGPAGAHTLLARVYHPGGIVDSAPVEVTAMGANEAPVFTSATIDRPDAPEAQAYSATLAGTATDGNPGDTLTFSKISGPAWLAVTGGGALSGTPAASDSGLNSFTVRVTDGGGLFSEATLRITVVRTHGVWINSAGGAWNTPANWLNGIVANGADNTAGFGTLDLTADATVTLDGARTIGQLVFGDTSPSHNWILNPGAGGALTLDTTTGTPSIAVNAQNATLGLILAGTKGFTKSGAGTLTLSGANTLTGIVTTDAGKLVIANNTLLNSTAAGTGLVVSPGGTLQLNAGAGGGSYPKCPITVNGAGTSALTGLYLNAGVNHSTQGKLILQTAPTTVRTTGSGTAQLSGFDINYTMIETLAAASGSVLSSTINVCGSGYGVNFSTAAGAATATGDLVIDGNLLNAGVNNFGVYFNGTGSVRLNGASAAFTDNLRNKLTVNTGTLVFGGSSDFAGGAYGGNVVMSGNATLKYDRSNSLQTFSGILSGAGSLVKSGGSTLALTGTNTYSGPTTVNGGVLQVNGVLAAGAVNVPGGTLAGTGTLGGATTVATGGTLEPGAAGIGTLTLNNTLTLSGTTRMELGKAGTTLTCDQVTGVTTLTYDGTLAVTSTGPDALAKGDTFQLFNAATRSGSFTTITLPALAAGLAWDTTPLATDGSIRVIETPVDAYTGWATRLTNEETRAKHLDPDHDGTNNLGEFAFNDDPLSPLNSGKISVKPGVVDGAEVLTITLPVRTGASFSPGTEGLVSLPVDGMIYRIQGCSNLDLWSLSIEEIPTDDAAPLRTGLPQLPAGWTYRSFHAPAGMPRVFLRAKVEDAP